MTKAMDATKQRIILAAESLFAQQGIGGVSAREIASAAGLRNNVSVQYHFGSMEGLLESIVRFRMGQLEINRSKLLREAEEAEKLNDLATLLNILCLPHIAITDDHGHHPYAAFMAQYLPRYHPTGFSWIMDRIDPTLPSLVRLLSLFRERLLYLPKEVLYRRLTSVTLHFLNVLMAHDVERSIMMQETKAVLMLQDCMAQIVAAMAVPYDDNIAPGLQLIVREAQIVTLQS